MTLSQQLTQRLGKGFSCPALTRMQKVAASFNREKVATLPQQLVWSHLIELIAIDSDMKRNFYAQLASDGSWNVRNLRNQIDAMLFERSAIAKFPESIINESLNN